MFRSVTWDTSGFCLSVTRGSPAAETETKIRKLATISTGMLYRRRLRMKTSIFRAPVQKGDGLPRQRSGQAISDGTCLPAAYVPPSTRQSSMFHVGPAEVGLSRSPLSFDL